MNIIYFLWVLSITIAVIFVILSKLNKLYFLRYGFVGKKQLHSLTPREFEIWCGEFLKKLGFENVEVTQATIDGGKDIIAEKDGNKYYVECKRYYWGKGHEFEVSRDIVQKLVGSMVGDGIKKGMILTTGIVTDRAKEYIKTLPKDMYVELIDGDELSKMCWKIREEELNVSFNYSPKKL